jgi:hypothetical protein
VSGNQKRISLLLREEQYTEISEKGINLSGLVRDLLDDYLSEHKITISVGEETKDLYDMVISNTGSSDEDLEGYLKQGLKDMLKDKIKVMQKIVDEIN